MAGLSSHGILSWNVSSIRKRESELRHILNSYQPVIALIQETHLYPGLTSPSFPGYNLLRADRQTGKGGGVALLINDRVAYTPINFPNLANAEVSGVRVPAGGADIAICSVYVPPSRGRYKELKAIYERLGNFYITAGDFNAHNTIWGGRTTNLSGQYLEKLLLHLDCRIHLPTSPTRIHPNNPSKDSTLDFCLTHSTLTDVKLTVLPDGSSDHKPILITLPENLTILNPRRVRLLTNWIGIEEDLGQVAWPTSVEANQNSIDNAVQLFTSHIQASMLNNTTGITLKNNYQHLLPKNILKIIKRKRKLKRKFLKRRSPDLKSKLNQINRKIRKALQKWELDRKIEKIKELDDNNKRWKVLRDWSPKPPVVPTLIVDGKSYFTGRDKANIIAQSLYERFSEHPADLRHSLEQDVDKFQLPKVDSNVPTILLSQVAEAIEHGKTKKSPGYDGICYKILRSLNIDALTFITHIFNAITRAQYFPDALKLGIVIVLPKEGKPPSSPQSYRPITLLPTLGKVYEYCFLSYLRLIEERLSIIPPEQHGFRANHSTGTQLARVSETLIRHYNQGKATVMVALDVEAAFDKVPPRYLLYKLSRFGFPDWTIRLLASYFSNRRNRVKVEDDLSDPFILRAGTPQGGLLSPFLYSLYTADIPLHSHSTTTALYADDTLLITSNERPVMAELNSNLALADLEIWLKRWKIKVNGGKSKASFLSHKDPGFTPEVFVASEQVALTTEIKYLGIVFDTGLTWSAQTRICLKTAKQRSAALLNQIRGLPATKETKTLLYLTYIRPILTYGVSAWGGASKSVIDPLIRLERMWIRTILGLGRYTKTSTYLDRAPFPLLTETLTNELQTLYDKTRHHDNPTIRTLGQYRRTDGRRRRYPLQGVAPLS